MRKDHGKKRHYQEQSMRGESSGLISKSRVKTGDRSFMNLPGLGANFGNIWGTLKFSIFIRMLQSSKCDYSFLTVKLRHDNIIMWIITVGRADFVGCR